MDSQITDQDIFEPANIPDYFIPPDYDLYQEAPFRLFEGHWCILQAPNSVLYQMAIIFFTIGASITFSLIVTNISALENISYIAWMVVIVIFIIALFSNRLSYHLNPKKRRLVEKIDKWFDDHPNMRLEK